MKGAHNLALTILLFCASIIAWELIVRAFQVPTFIFPAPSKVSMALWRGFASGLYQKHLFHTLLETVLGFLLGSALGFFLGTAVAPSDGSMTVRVDSVWAFAISASSAALPAPAGAAAG